MIFKRRKITLGLKFNGRNNHLMSNFIFTIPSEIVIVFISTMRSTYARNFLVRIEPETKDRFDFLKKNIYFIFILTGRKYILGFVPLSLLPKFKQQDSPHHCFYMTVCSIDTKYTSFKILTKRLTLIKLRCFDANRYYIPHCMLSANEVFIISKQYNKTTFIYAEMVKIKIYFLIFK